MVPENVEEGSNVCNISNKNKRKVSRVIKAHVEETTENLEPYWKKPKLTEFSFDLAKMTQPESYERFRKQDVLWMVAINNSNSIPMWTGFNSSIDREK